MVNISKRSWSRYGINLIFLIILNLIIFSLSYFLSIQNILDRIEEVDAPTLKKLIENEKYIVVVFYDDECEDCDQILEALETIGKYINNNLITTIYCCIL